jgi:putative membrane protein
MPGMGGMPHIAFSVHTLLTRWDMSAFPIAVALALVAIAVWYLQADWKLAARGRRWSGLRTAAFMAGLVTVDIALQSPLAPLTGTYFQAHVVQHLLLMAVAPPLLAMGAPSTLFLQTAGRRSKERWLAVLRSRPFAALSHPVVVSFLYYGVMFVFFLTDLLGVAMEHMWLMDAINLLFLLGGTLFWWPMVGIDPIIHWRLGYGLRMFLVLIGSGIEAFLGISILFYSHPIAPMYSVASTRTGGALLWTAADVLSVIAFIPIYLQWQRTEERAGRRLDDRIARLWPASGAESPGGGRRQSAWEAAWRDRTGSVPTLDGGRLKGAITSGIPSSGRSAASTSRS